MKTYMLLLIFSLFFGMLNAQNTEIALLKNQLAIAETNQNMVEIAEYSDKLAILYAAEKDFDNALKNSFIAIKTHQNLKNYTKIAEIQFLIGKIYFQKKIYVKSVEYLQKAFPYYQSKKMEMIEMEILNLSAEAYYFDKKIDKAEFTYTNLLQLAQEYKEEKMQAQALSKLVVVKTVKLKLQDAIFYANELVLLFEKNNNTDELAISLQNLGFLYRQQNDLKKSEDNFRKAIEQLNKLNKENFVVLNNLAVTYSMLGNFEKANEYYVQLIDIAKKNKQPEDLANAYNFAAASFLLRKKSFEAVELAHKSIEIATPIKANQILLEAYWVLNEAYIQQGDLKLAKDALKNATDLQFLIETEKNAHKEDVLKKQIEAQKAENDLLLLISEKEKQNLNFKQAMLENEKREQAFQLLKKDKDLQEAGFKNQKLAKEQTEQQLRLAQQLLETERKNKQIITLEQQKKLQELALENEQVVKLEQNKALELEKNKNQLLEKDKKLSEFEIQQGKNRVQLAYIIILAGVLVLLILTLAFWRNHKKNKLLHKQKQVILEKNSELQASEEELQQTADALSKTNDNLEAIIVQVNEQKHIIEKKNDDIIASINYALRIQQAIIPSEQETQKVFPESFVFFRPRDIVSGDFYWFANKGNLKILAVADCTGHGVSGAFMTMIGNNILNQIVNGQGVYAPNEILNLMPEMLEKTLLHSEGKIRDGMDIAIISILTNEKTIVLNYAGAMNPLYYVQNNEFFEIKADKTPIGGQMKEGFVYKNNEISLYSTNESGEKLKLETTIYLCSDGFQDQFGGVKNKKFMVRNLRNLLFENTNKPMKAQKEILENTFDDWKSDAKQTDDVLILAFKI